MDREIFLMNITSQNMETTRDSSLAREVDDLVREIDEPTLTFTREKPSGTGWQTAAEREEPILILLDFLPSIAPMTIQDRLRELQRENRRRLIRVGETKLFDARQVEKMGPIDDLPTLSLDVETTKKWTIDDVRNFWDKCDEERRARCAALLPLPHVWEKNGYRPIPQECVNGASIHDPFWLQGQKQLPIHRCAKPKAEPDRNEKLDKAENRRASEPEPSKEDDEPWFILPKDQIRKKVKISPNLSTRGLTDT